MADFRVLEVCSSKMFVRQRGPRGTGMVPQQSEAETGYYAPRL